MPYRFPIGVGLCALALSAGCQTPADTIAPTEASTEARDALSDQRLSWADLTYAPQGFDQVAEGPNALAITPSGTTLVLDRLGHRIVALEDNGAPRVFASVAQDVEDMAVGPDGAVVAYSPLRARAWLFEANGAPAGEVAIPRSFREVTEIGLAASRIVRIHTMHQETFTVGSPNAMLPLAVAMRTKKEGAYQLADGRGVATLVSNGRATVTLLSQARGRERSEVIAKHAIPGQATAARLVGVSNTVACMRVEEVTSSPKISVARRAVCIDAQSGEVTLDVALPNKGAYLPRRELAVGAGKLALLHPTADGLAVRSWNVRGGAN